MDPLGPGFALAESAENKLHGSLTSGINYFLDILQRVGLDFACFQFTHLNLHSSMDQR